MTYPTNGLVALQIAAEMDNQATRQLIKPTKERVQFYIVHYGMRHLQCWHFL